MRLKDLGRRCWLHLLLALSLLCGGMWLGGCDSAIYDYEGDCSVTYRVKFNYELNMRWVDEFAGQVKSVRLYAFDSSGKLVWSGTENGEALARPGYAMELPLPAGQYDLVAWCGGEGSFDIASADKVGTLNDLLALMNRSADDEGTYSDKDLSPLFHGMMSRVELPDVYGTTVDVATIPLVKNTNRIHVELYHVSGCKLNPNSFLFTITDVNGKMNYDNSLMSDETLSYRPWQTVRPEAGDSSFYVSMTTGRLIAGANARLIVTDGATGKQLINIRLIDYLVMAKDQYSNHAMSDQEYLNREDEYWLRFAIDGGCNPDPEDPDPEDPDPEDPDPEDPDPEDPNPEDPDPEDPDPEDPDPEDPYDWYLKAGIFINSWHVMIQNEDLH